MKNIEQQIKQELEERRIAPSTSAWDKINEELSTPKKSYLWIWKYAAAVVLLAGLSMIYFIPNQSTTDLVQTKDNTTVETLSNQNEVDGQENFANTPPEIVNPNSSTNESQTLQAVSSDVLNPSKIIDSNRTQRIVKNSTTHEKLADNKVREGVPIIQLNDNAISTKNVEPANMPSPNENLAAYEKTPETASKKEGVKVNREKLLFYIENEHQIKKPSRIAFEGNTLKIDLHD